MVKIAEKQEVVGLIEKSSYIVSEKKEEIKKKFSSNKMFNFVSDNENNHDILSALCDLTHEKFYENLVDEHTAYLVFLPFDDNPSNFVNHFSELFVFAEEYMKKLGYNKLTIGIEVSRVEELSLIFKHGFTNFERYAFKPNKVKNDYKNNLLVVYYSKNI